METQTGDSDWRLGLATGTGWSYWPGRLGMARGPPGSPRGWVDSDGWRPIRGGSSRPVDRIAHHLLKALGQCHRRRGCTAQPAGRLGRRVGRQAPLRHPAMCADDAREVVRQSAHLILPSRARPSSPPSTCTATCTWSGGWSSPAAPDGAAAVQCTGTQVSSISIQVAGVCAVRQCTSCGAHQTATHQCTAAAVSAQQQGNVRHAMARPPARPPACPHTPTG